MNMECSLHAGGLCAIMDPETVLRERVEEILEH